MSNKVLGNESLGTLVKVVLGAAQLHGTFVAIGDLAQLLPAGTSSEDLQTAFESHPGLSGSYILRDGFVFRKSSGDPSFDYGERQGRSAANIEAAKRLTKRIRTRETLMIAVSGSTSYRAASQKDDVDLFCVTRSGMMWVFLTRSLLLARAWRLLKRSDPPVCLSCVMDADYARGLFRAERGALFARDALAAEVVLGQDHYRSLLEDGSWIERYFPKLYAVRTSRGRRPFENGPATPSWAKVVNLFLYFTLGSYIRRKALLHNRLLALGGKELAIFQARIGPGHLIYESAKYRRLRGMYDEIHPAKDMRV